MTKQTVLMLLPTSTNSDILQNQYLKMQKSLILFLLSPFFGYSQVPNYLEQGYNFLTMNSKNIKLYQSNDTLYSYEFYYDFFNKANPISVSKILSIEKSNDFFLFKLELLDSAYLNRIGTNERKYSVLAIEKVDNKTINFLPVSKNLTKQQLDTLQINSKLLKTKYSLTFYSDKYLAELSLLKKITTNEDIQAIMKFTKGKEFKDIADKYSKSELGDMYNVRFSEEILTRACINAGYNPINAGYTISNIQKK
ncbi:MAG: hypothetical protein K2X26_14655 [Chitinophagaceae bacterium]|nr:hypothetical protein [Chitinophagaceae bacterium]